MVKTTFIYILIDPIDNTIRYVGKTNNPKERFKAHTNIARDNNTHKRNWINKLRKCGCKPEIEIIDEVQLSEWKYWERFWVAYYRFIGCDLVNYTNGGDGLSLGNQTTFRKGNKAKAVVGYNKEGNKVYEFESDSEACRYLGLHRSVVNSCCLGRIKTVKDLVWFFKEDVKNIEHTSLIKVIKNNFRKVYKPNSGQFKAGQKGIRSKKVIVENIHTGISTIYESGSEAANLIGVPQPTIAWVIKNKKILNKQYKVKFYEKETSGDWTCKNG
jgi:hypothetical protein